MRCRVLAATALLLAAGCTNSGTHEQPPQPQKQPRQAAPTEAPCEFHPIYGEVPSWAHAGFTPGAEITYTFSKQGNMLAVLFGHPLYSPPLEDRSNKILWRSRPPFTPPAPLHIEARLNATGTPVKITINNGPGPSTIDLPTPGCWRLNLQWGPYTDSIDLEYVPQ